jgi:hypothetical protein
MINLNLNHLNIGMGTPVNQKKDENGLFRELSCLVFFGFPAGIQPNGTPLTRF